MDFQNLIEPIELIEPIGFDIELENQGGTVKCNKGYVCKVGEAQL